MASPPAPASSDLLLEKPAQDQHAPRLPAIVTNPAITATATAPPSAYVSPTGDSRFLHDQNSSASSVDPSPLVDGAQPAPAGLSTVPGGPTPQQTTAITSASSTGVPTSSSTVYRDSQKSAGPQSPGSTGNKGSSSAARYAVFASAAQPTNSPISTLWGPDLEGLDDDLHRIEYEPDGRGGQRIVTSEKHPTIRSWANMRAFVNGGTVLVLLLALLMLFAGYPILTNYRHHSDNLGGYGLGGTNASGQVGVLSGVRTSLVDPDTPRELYTRPSADGTTEMQLVFSDEFNTPGRSFYPGDDAFWEAVDLHYWATNNYEWYDPAAVTTTDGALRITISEHPEHNLNFRGGMIQSWNKFCFTGGVLVAGVRLPGKATVAGLWPAVWLMGNLGRAGYGATLEGNWPYSYDACDTGTLPNQTDPITLRPDIDTLGNCPFNQKHLSKSLSFLPGQRLSACTCPDDDHPGPKLPDGTYRGRMAPEIDLFEAQVNGQDGMTVSQSFQAAPFNAYYRPVAPPNLIDDRTIINSYTGELTQQSLSGVTPTNQLGVQYLANGSTGIFTEYALEYEPGHNGYIEWTASGKPAWRLTPAQMAADHTSNISARPIAPEPMYIIANLGISQNFGTPSWKGLRFPSAMDIDYIRVYQANPNVGCDPPDYPTAAYIARHSEVYNNPNLTLWGGDASSGGYGANWPRNRLNPGGCEATPSTQPGSPTKPVPKARAYASAAIGNDQPQCDISAWNRGQNQ